MPGEPPVLFSENLPRNQITLNFEKTLQTNIAPRNEKSPQPRKHLYNQNPPILEQLTTLHGNGGGFRFRPNRDVTHAERSETSCAGRCDAVTADDKYSRHHAAK